MVRHHLIINVDDNEASRHRRHRILSDAGFEVADAATGADALRLARERQPDLVLLDVQLPDLDAFEVCRRLKAGKSENQILVVHVWTEAPDAYSHSSDLQNGADAYLTEPVHPEVLTATVRALLEGRTTEAHVEKPAFRVQAMPDRMPPEAPPDIAVNAFSDWHEALKRQDLLRSIMDNVPTMIAVLRAPDFTYEFVNRAFQDWAPGKQMEGRRLADVFPEIRDAVEPVLKNVIATGEPYRAVDAAYAMQSAPGTPAERRYFTFSWIPLPGPDGKPDRVLTVAVETTEAVRQKQQLSDALARNEAIFANMTEGLLIADARGNVLSMNRAAHRLYGAPPESANRNIASFSEFTLRELDGRIVPREEWPLARILRGETLSRCELRVSNHARGRDWIATFGGSPIRDETGAIVLGVLTFHDITERKRTEQALRESEAQFRTLADSIAQFAWMADESGGIFWYNRRWYEYTGTTLEEMKGGGWQKVYHPDHVDRVVTGFKHSLETGERWEDTFPLRGKDGNYRWFLSRAMPIRDDRGRVVRWFGTNTDITEQLETERRLRESERDFRQLADSIPHAVWVLSADGRFEYLNRRLLELTGLPVEEAYDPQIWQRLVHPDDEAQREAVLAEFLRTGEPFGLEFRVRGADGNYRWKAGRGVAVRDENGRITRYFGTITDIHDQRVAQEALRQAQKLESVGLLAGGIAHDFNNLLTGIIGNASMVKDLLPYRSPAAEMVQRIIQSGEQAAHLTRQLLAYAGKGRFIVQPVNLSELVGEAAPLIQSSISKAITVHFQLKPDIPAIETDPAQMKQVFMNLAINAAEAIGEGPGMVSVSTGDLTVSVAAIPDALDGSEVAPGHYVFLDVRDTGAGMDEATKAKIFDPFFTTKFHGRGLGLAAVAGIVRAHNGAIQVTSAPGAGTDVRVLLPVLQSAGTEPKTPEEFVGGLQETGTVLFVDDEEVVRDVAEHALTPLGYRVLLARSGPEAIDTLRREGDTVDLVVLDLGMPGMSGQETLPHLRRLRPDVKVVVSSGYNEAEALSLFRGARISGFIQKPYTVQNLAREVKAAMS